MLGFVRYHGPKGIRYGVLEGEEVLELAEGPFEEAVRHTEVRHGLSDVRLLAPCEPSKVVLVSGNYPVVIEDFDKPPRRQPWIFMKPATAVIGPGDPIPWPRWARSVTYEPELAVVIGRVCRDVAPEDVSEYLLGYPCVNDVMASASPDEEVVMTRAKSHDGFCPIGPVIVPDIDVARTRVRALVGGKVTIDAAAADMRFGVEDVVSHISQSMTLLPGDVISTGAADVQPVERGREVTIRIDGIGDLTNPVA